MAVVGGLHGIAPGIGSSRRRGVLLLAARPRRLWQRARRPHRPSRVATPIDRPNAVTESPSAVRSPHRPPRPRRPVPAPVGRPDHRRSDRRDHRPGAGPPLARRGPPRRQPRRPAAVGLQRRVASSTRPRPMVARRATCSSTRRATAAQIGPGPQRAHLLRPLGERDQGRHRPLRRRPTQPLVPQGRSTASGSPTSMPSAGSGKAFHRISSRKAPHNGYTSTAALRAMALKRGGRGFDARSTCTAARSWRPARPRRAQRRSGSGSRTGRA